MTAMKRRRNMKRIFVLLVLIGLITTLTPAVQAAVVLWVVPEDSPTWYTGPSDDDFLLDETVIVDTYMDSTFSGTVIVLNQASYGNPPADAENVHLKFFVLDASNINTITIEAVTRIQPNDPNNGISDNLDPDPTPESIISFDYDEYGSPPVPAGWYAEYLIGTIPFSGGPDKTGNIDDGTFNPDNADCYIKIPFTINFNDIPDMGFTLYVYAENDLTGKEHAKTAYSHDAGFTHVPEFSTIAIPVAAILGLLFLFNRRKRRK